MDLQALWFRSDRFTEAQAVAWANDHDFKSDTVRTREAEDGSVTHYILPQFSPDDAVEGSWRTIADTFPDGISASVCERKKNMDSKLYSTFEVKAFDEEQRIIRGIASTPNADREGDIVMPKGAQFSVPFPLLDGHDHSMPVGQVTKAEVADDGIYIEAFIAKDSDLPYIEKAWRQVKAGLKRGLSIGFRSLKSKATATGRIFESFEILELSLVTIPANAGAGIAEVKQYDAEGVQVTEEQLLELESRVLDVKERAAATLKKANETLKSTGDN